MKKMRSKLEDPLSGIYLALSGCFNGIAMFSIGPDSVVGTILIIAGTIFLGLFILRFIRMWGNREYNPPTGWLPLLKFSDAALWLFVIILWWNEANSTDDPLGIVIMIVIVIHGVKELYDAIKLMVIKRRK